MEEEEEDDDDDEDMMKVLDYYYYYYYPRKVAKFEVSESEISQYQRHRFSRVSSVLFSF
jgi:hypothetical protein